MVCKAIPIKPKECSNCNKIICYFCELALVYKNGVQVSETSCPNCKTEEKPRASGERVSLF